MIAKVVRCLFPYKNFSALDGHDSNSWKDIQDRIGLAFPATRTDGDYSTNKSLVMDKWTQHERKTFQTVLRSFSRWEVDYTHAFIRSTECKEKTTNMDGICDACHAVSKDKSLQHAVRKVGRSNLIITKFHVNL